MFKNTLIARVYPLWLSVQTEMSQIFRWEPYVKADKKLRKQSTLHHAFSICLVVMVVAFKLKKHYKALDTELLKDAFTLHDIPEGMLKKKFDVVNADKNQSHDLTEYLIFKKNFEKLDKDVFEHMHTAYLLQYAHKPDKDLGMFPREALNTIHRLRKTHDYEVKLFRALEQWEYIFYAYEAYVKNKNVFLLTNVLREQVPHLQKYAHELLGFREEIFTDEFEKECLEFIEANKDLPTRPR